jgi:hypothetical protein
MTNDLVCAARLCVFYAGASLCGAPSPLISTKNKPGGSSSLLPLVLLLQKIPPFFITDMPSLTRQAFFSFSLHLSVTNQLSLSSDPAGFFLRHLDEITCYTPLSNHWLVL